MASGISLLIFKDNSGLDITDLVQEIQWSGRKGSSARSIQVKIADDDGYRHARSGIDAEEGYQCIFSWNGEELFRGIIMKTTQDSGKSMSFTAYDNGIYLANNKDTFIYEGKTATDVFRDVCGRFGLPTGETAECSYRIPELTKSGTTAFDAIADALSLDFEATGIRHYIISRRGELNLLTRRENIMQWVIGTGENMLSYSFSKNIENIKTRIRMFSDEKTVAAEAVNADLEQKIGVFADIEKPDETLTQAQLQELCVSMLTEKSSAAKTLTVEAMGIPDVISGIGVFIMIPHIGLNRTFYVDEDTHTFAGRKHTMSLKLDFANDLEREPAGSGQTERSYGVGDIVQFAGGPHYVSSSASSPTGSPCKPGPAKITLQAKGAKHPWHLIHTDSQTRVYGWVDEGSFQ